MAIAIDGSNTGSTGEGSTSVGSNLTTSFSNDLIFVFVFANGINSAPTVSSITGVSGATWTRRVQVQPTGSLGNYLNAELWYSTAVSAGAYTITANLTNADTNLDAATITVFGVSSVNTSTPFDSNSSLPATLAVDVFETGTPEVTVSTSNATDMLLVLYAGEPKPSGLTSGFTQIEGFESSVGAYYQYSAYEVVSATQSSTTVGWPGTGIAAGFLVIGDALIEAPPFTYIGMMSASSVGTPTLPGNLPLSGHIVSQTQLSYFPVSSKRIWPTLTQTLPQSSGSQIVAGNLQITSRGITARIGYEPLSWKAYNQIFGGPLTMNSPGHLLTYLGEMPQSFLSLVQQSIPGMLPQSSAGSRTIDLEGALPLSSRETVQYEGVVPAGITHVILLQESDFPLSSKALTAFNSLLPAGITHIILLQESDFPLSSKRLLPVIVDMYPLSSRILVPYNGVLPTASKVIRNYDSALEQTSSRALELLLSKLPLSSRALLNVVDGDFPVSSIRVVAEEGMMPISSAHINNFVIYDYLPLSSRLLEIFIYGDIPVSTGRLIEGRSNLPQSSSYELSYKGTVPSSSRSLEVFAGKLAQSSKLLEIFISEMQQTSLREVDEISGFVTMSSRALWSLASALPQSTRLSVLKTDLGPQSSYLLNKVQGLLALSSFERTVAELIGQVPLSSRIMIPGLGYIQAGWSGYVTYLGPLPGSLYSHVFTADSLFPLSWLGNAHPLTYVGSIPLAWSYRPTTGEVITVDAQVWAVNIEDQALYFVVASDIGDGQ